MSILSDRACYDKALTRRTDRYGRFYGRGWYGKVVQVSSRHDKLLKFSMGDGDAWPIYATWCYDVLKEQKFSTKVSRHMLKVYSIRDNTVDDTFTVALIEKLVPYCDAPEHARVIMEKLNFYNCDNLGEHEKEDFETNNSSLIEAYHHISEFYSSIGGMWFDLHLGNIMYRPSDDSVVITDPFASHGCRMGKGRSLTEEYKNCEPYRNIMRRKG